MSYLQGGWPPFIITRKKKPSSGHPAAATADSGVSSGSATTASTSGRKCRNRTQRSSKAAATTEILTGDFTINTPLPQPSTPPTDTRSFLPSFTTAIQAPASMELDCNKTPPPPPPYVQCPFMYKHKDQLILKLAMPAQMAEHCESLRRKYADSTDTAIQSFIELPLSDMVHHVQHSLDHEYQPFFPYGQVLRTPSFRSPPSPSSSRDTKRTK